jgi:RNA polymerase sigma factor (sigma-70 family)
MTDDGAAVAASFEDHRPRLRAIAYRMLGSVAEADDAVQETWLRLSRSDAAQIDNLGGWLTTVTARVCLDQLRARHARREDPVGIHVPDPIVSNATDGPDPEQEALLADSVGLAMLVVLETLTPAERLAFVLHDVFAIPFEDIAPIVDRTPTAARQLASRARRRIQGSATTEPQLDLTRQWEVGNAFLAAARAGDFSGLLAVLDPNVVARADFGVRSAATMEVRGPQAVGEQAMLFRRFADGARRALINGGAGFVVFLPDGRPYAVIGFTMRSGRISAIDILADPERLARIDLTVLHA